MPADVPGPAAGARMTVDYVRSLGRLAYLWGWPLVNMHNRLPIMEKVPSPGLLGGVVPAAPPGSVGMLHDYVTPDERLVACPNQDVVYGFGILDARRGPSVVQVPDFGGRFWVYQAVDQRTDSFVRLGAMHQTRPGRYLLAPASWDGPVPDGIAEVFRFDTRIAVCAPRGFMDDTEEDRAAILGPDQGREQQEYRRQQERQQHGADQVQTALDDPLRQPRQIVADLQQQQVLAEEIVGGKAI